MLTRRHLCLLSIAALSLAAVTPALASPDVDAVLKGDSPAIEDPGHLCCRQPARHCQGVNDRSARAFNARPDPPGKTVIQDANERPSKIVLFKRKKR